jgi:F0F1-type ATP synthase membrane subunit a
MIKLDFAHSIASHGIFNKVLLCSFLSVVFAVVLLLFSRSSKLIKKITEMTVGFITDLCNSKIHHNPEHHIVFLFCVFIFILFNNLIGLFPRQESFAGKMINNLLFSLMSFFYIIWHGIRVRRSKVYQAFIPAGMPPIIKPVIFVI